MRHAIRAVSTILFLAAAVFALRPASAETFYVEGYGGVPLAVTVAGPEDGPEILFLHGIGMGADSFSEQLDSDLAEKFRMVALDLRGHGMSGKPWVADAYATREVWAGDVQRVIAATGLKRPIIVAWSYGTLVAADYLLLNGSDCVSGLVLVSALGGLVSSVPPSDPPDEDILAQLQHYRALREIPELAVQQEATEILAPMLFETTADGPSAKWIASTNSLGILVPPYAQPYLRAHPNDNRALVASLAGTPLQVFHGSKDLGLRDADLAALKRAIPQAEIHTFEGAGHSLFAERPAAFNAAIAAFVEENWRIPTDR